MKTRESYTVTNVTVTFEWDPPAGSGPEAIVDNYIISILPMPASHPISNVVYFTTLNVTLDYNTTYNASIAAFNCAGESRSVVLSDIEYGMIFYLFCSLTSKFPLRQDIDTQG